MIPMCLCVQSCTDCIVVCRFYTINKKYHTTTVSASSYYNTKAIGSQEIKKHIVPLIFCSIDYKLYANKLILIFLQISQYMYMELEWTAPLPGFIGHPFIWKMLATGMLQFYTLRLRCCNYYVPLLYATHLITDLCGFSKRTLFPSGLKLCKQFWNINAGNFICTRSSQIFNFAGSLEN